MAQKVKMKLFQRMKNGKRRQVVTIHGEGRTKSLAKANARRTLKSYFRRNVEMGFYDGTGFHPIRASRDYDSAEVKHGPEGKKARAKRAKKSGALFSRHY